MEWLCSADARTSFVNKFMCSVNDSPAHCSVNAALRCHACTHTSDCFQVIGIRCTGQCARIKCINLSEPITSRLLSFKSCARANTAAHRTANEKEEEKENRNERKKEKEEKNHMEKLWKVPEETGCFQNTE